MKTREVLVGIWIAPNFKVVDKKCSMLFVPTEAKKCATAEKILLLKFFGNTFVEFGNIDFVIIIFIKTEPFYFIPVAFVFLK